MDRIALAKRLEGLSKVFASTTPYHRDLKAMAEVLSKVEDEKFATILSPDFTSEASGVEAAAPSPFGAPGLRHPGTAPSIPGRGIMREDPEIAYQALISNPEATIEDALAFSRKYPNYAKKPLRGVMRPTEKPVTSPVTVPAMSAEASEENTGMFWSKEASEAIQNNLVRDVLGMNKSICCDTKRHLEKNQIPDGTHDGEKASNLTKEQTPKLADVLKSDIVEKSHGKVKKEASAEEDDKKDDKKEDKAATSEKEECDKLEDKKEEKSAALSPEAKAKKEKDEAAAMKKKVEELAKAKSDAKKDKNATEEEKVAEEIGFAEGIELGEPMDEITLDAAEQAKLSQLFA
jgi:hypothetical protein